MSKPVDAPPFKLCSDSTYLDVNIQVQSKLSTQLPKLFEVIENIKSQKKNIRATLDKLKNHYLSHKKIELQSAETAVMTQLSVELAKLLLNEDGNVNIDIIPTLLETFVRKNNLPANHEINLSYTLKTLQSSKSLRDKIAQITHPDSNSAPANRVIRAVLDLSEDITPTDLHAKQTALAALLSHLRQGSDGSCFASPIVIWLLSSNLEKCVDDFTSLLKSSKLTRKIQNVERDFPFLLRTSNKSLDTPILLLDSGKMIGKQGNKSHLSEVPSFIKACESLGLNDCYNVYDVVTDKLFINALKDQKKIKTSVKQILVELAKYKHSISENSKSKPSLHFLTAYFAFEGQVNSPLLAVWENAIAGMAEADHSSMITSAIIETTLQVIKDKLVNTLPNQKSLVEKITQLVNDELSLRINLHYDPVVPHYSQNNMLHTTEGAFVLYDKGDYSRPSGWIRIDNPQAFQSFSSRVIEATLQKIHDKKLNANTLITDQFNKIAHYIETDEYLLKILKQYYNKNQNTIDPITNYKKILYAPWVTKSGNSFNSVLQVYLENYIQNQTRVLNPVNGHDLLQKIILLGKEMPKNERAKYDENPTLLIPARIPNIHAFSLMMGRAKLKSGWQDTTHPKDWIKKNVIDLGKEVASAPISKSMKESLINHCYKKFLDRADKDQFLLKINLFTAKQSILEFRNALITMLGNQLKAGDKQVIDSYIYQILPIDLQRKLEKSAIHFADSNWNDGLNDVHFCFVINPGNGKLEVWSVRDDGKNLIALDQKTWLQSWEIFK